MSIYSVLQNVLKGHGAVAASNLAIANKSVNEIEALSAIRNASAAMNKGAAIKRHCDIGELKALASIDVERIIQRATRHDPRKLSDLAESVNNGVLTGAECNRVLPFFISAFKSDAMRVERYSLESAGAYANNRKTFCILLEKGGAIESIREGRSIVAYRVIDSAMWRYLATL